MKSWRKLPVGSRDCQFLYPPNNMTATESNQLVRADRYNTLRQRLENSDFDIDIKDIPSLTDRESNF